MDKAERIKMLEQVVDIMTRLEEAVKDMEAGENDIVHSLYDELTCTIATAYEPELMTKARKVVKSIEFWYS